MYNPKDIIVAIASLPQDYRRFILSHFCPKCGDPIEPDEYPDNICSDCSDEFDPFPSGE